MSLVRRSSQTRKRRGSDASGPVTYCVKGRRNSVASDMRWDRKFDAEIFRHQYDYDGSIGKKVYVNSSGDTDSWEDKSIGCMWVAVYGLKSMCVAIKGDVEVDRYPNTAQIGYVRHLFSVNVISEIEDIALSSKNSRQTLDKPVKKPFAVVSLIPSKPDVNQESGDKASGAVEYVKERMKSGLAFNRIETIQIAISALQHQCNRELSAKEIWVCVLDQNEDSLLPRAKVEAHLTDINKPKPVQTSEIMEGASPSIMEAPMLTNEIEEGATRSKLVRLTITSPVKSWREPLPV